MNSAIAHFREAQIAALIDAVPGHSGAPSHSGLARAGPQRCRAGAQGRSGRIVSLGAGWPEPASGSGPRTGDDPGDGGGVAACCTRYGYDPEAPLEKVVTAFQRHFRPSRVDGMADGETRAVLSGLIALYDAEKGDARMKTMGLLAGMSWESSSVYYQLINRGRCSSGWAACIRRRR